MKTLLKCPCSLRFLSDPHHPLFNLFLFFPCLSSSSQVDQETKWGEICWDFYFVFLIIGCKMAQSFPQRRKRLCSRNHAQVHKVRTISPTHWVSFIPSRPQKRAHAHAHTWRRLQFQPKHKECVVSILYSVAITVWYFTTLLRYNRYIFLKKGRSVSCLHCTAEKCYLRRMPSPPQSTEGVMTISQLNTGIL